MNKYGINIFNKQGPLCYMPMEKVKDGTAANLVMNSLILEQGESFLEIKGFEQASNLRQFESQLSNDLDAIWSNFHPLIFKKTSDELKLTYILEAIN